MKKDKSAGRQSEPDNVDVAIGEDIQEQFAYVYKELFNSTDDRKGLERLQERIGEVRVNASDVDCITPEVIKAAVNKLKSAKNDISGEFSSEALLNAPDEFFVVISDLFKAFLIHNDFTEDILACAFVPLLKGALKDDTKSDNYRAIAISSLILKVFDNMNRSCWQNSNKYCSNWFQLDGGWLV